MKYPTEAFLEKVKGADVTNFHEFMAMIKPEWAFGNFGWRQEGDIYYLSTGGWSGNEDIISAMQDNQMFWLMYWARTSRGGHYIFAPITMDVINKLNADGETISVEAEPPLAYKALCVIEYITSHENIEKERTWFIYEAAHVALGECLANHAEWVNEVEALYTNLRAKGLV